MNLPRFEILVISLFLEQSHRPLFSALVPAVEFSNLFLNKQQLPRHIYKYLVAVKHI